MGQKLDNLGTNTFRLSFITSVLPKQQLLSANVFNSYHISLEFMNTAP